MNNNNAVTPSSLNSKNDNPELPSSSSSASAGVSAPSGSKGPHKVNGTSETFCPERNGSATSSMEVSSSGLRSVPSGNRNNVAVEDLSTEEDDCGDSDDQYCVYTYKGDGNRLAADLPSSFFKFHPSDSSSCAPSTSSSRCCHSSSRLKNSDSNNSNNNKVYSPDMDFLEMDFDPGGSGDGCGDADTEEESEATVRNSIINNNPNSIINNDQASVAVVLSQPVVTRSILPQRNERTLLEPRPHCSRQATDCSAMMDEEIKLRLVKSLTFPGIGTSSSGSVGSSNSSTRAMAMSVSAPVFQDKPEQPCPTVIPAGKSSEDTMELEVDGVMIWSIKEAQEISINQIGRSACGATACLNVLSALGCIMTTLSQEFVNNCVGTRLRAEHADLPEYLLSRSNAGATQEDLIAGIHRASNGLIYGRFFEIRPNTSPSALNKWLLHWICKGAVPIATLNCQIRRPSEQHIEIPDAWHHQMIFGVMRQGIFLTNPLECVPTAELLPQLSSRSVLLVRREDVTKRTGPLTDLRKLARFPNPKWNEMNVLGQVSNMLLEEIPVVNGSAGLARRTRTSHISIPASYKAGISLFIRESNSASCALLKEAPEF